MFMTRVFLILCIAALFIKIWYVIIPGYETIKCIHSTTSTIHLQTVFTIV